MPIPDGFSQTAVDSSELADATPASTPPVQELTHAADAAQAERQIQVEQYLAGVRQHRAAARRRLVLLAVLAINLIVCVAVACDVLSPNSILPQGAEFGLCLAQVSLSACGLALMTAPLTLRMTLAGLFLAITCLSLGILVIRIGDVDEFVAYVFAAIFIAHWLFLLLPLGLVRIAYGWRIEHADRVPVAAAREWQFSLRQLLGWMLAIAVLLGLGRWVMPKHDVAEALANEGVEMAVGIGVMTAFNLLIALPMIFTALARRIALVWTTVSFLATFLVSWTELRLLAAIEPLAADAIFYNINGAHAAWLGGCLLAIGWGGYRLVKVGR